MYRLTNYSRMHVADYSEATIVTRITLEVRYIADMNSC